jgi:hypothetical protein
MSRGRQNAGSVLLCVGSVRRLTRRSNVNLDQCGERPPRLSEIGRAQGREVHVFGGARTRHDPDAPEASSLVPSVNVVVTNHAGDILMIRRTDGRDERLPRRCIAPGSARSTALWR